MLNPQCLFVLSVAILLTYAKKVFPIRAKALQGTLRNQYSRKSCHHLYTTDSQTCFDAFIAAACTLTYTPPAAKKEKHRKPNTNWPQNNEILKAKVAKELNGVILINIIKEKYSFRGNVKIKADMYLDDNKKMLKYQPGETVTVKIIGYDKKHKSYNAVFI